MYSHLQGNRKEIGQTLRGGNATNKFCMGNEVLIY